MNVKRYLLDNRCDECQMVETDTNRGFVALADYIASVLAAGTLEEKLAHAEFDLKSASEAMLRYARDAKRLTWLEEWITDNSSGFEIYPIGPDEEFGPDENTVVRIRSWALADKRWPVTTLRAAIDAAAGWEPAPTYSVPPTPEELEGRDK